MGANFPYTFGNISEPHIFGWRGSSASARVYLPETIAYLNALGIPNDSNVNIYGITNNQLWNAVDDYGLAVIPAGLFNPSFPIYLAIGGTADTHKINYTNPVDSDAAHRLSFFGGWAHDENGFTANGVNAYADTHFVPDSKYGINPDDAHHSNYESVGVASNGVHGCNNGAGSSSRQMFMQVFNNFVRNSINLQGAVTTNFSYSSTGTGTFIVSKLNESGLGRLYHNGVLQGAEPSSTGPAPIVSYYIGARNNNGSASVYYTGVIKHYTIGLGLTPQQALILHNAAHTLNVSLNRGATL